jgi:hypothetical protein
MAISDLTILNVALALVGIKRATDTAENRKAIRVYDAIYEQARNECFDLPHDWKFATARKELSLIYELTIDSVPTPVAWSAGVTLTGATSSTTCTVVSKVSNTVYLITKPSGDFTDGEVISDGTNSRDCGAGYPAAEEKTPDFGYDHQYKLPANFRRVIGMFDKANRQVSYEYRRELYVDDGDNEIDIFATDESEAFIKFICLRTNVATWPAWFARLVILNIAMYLCEPMKQKQSKQNQLERMWLEALEKAISSNGLEDVDVNSSYEDIDRGNTDIVDAAGDEGVNKRYIVQRDS